MRSTYKEAFVDVTAVAEWDAILRSLVAFVLFLVVTQLVKALRHSQPFSVFAKVYHKAAMDILVFAVSCHPFLITSNLIEPFQLMFFIWVAAFSCLGSALYGTLSSQFSRPDNIVLSIVALLTGHYEFDNLAFGHYSGLVGWRIFIVSFMMFAMGSLTAYVITISLF
jgi:hypothetical protein